MVHAWRVDKEKGDHIFNFFKKEKVAPPTRFFLFFCLFSVYFMY